MLSFRGTKGITIWQDNEPVGFQDVWHFHMHVKSRLENDALLWEVCWVLKK
jgi:diadenosine tetraphosphate (Ap4A) HIT family hydrolase